MDHKYLSSNVNYSNHVFFDKRYHEHSCLDSIINIIYHDINLLVISLANDYLLWSGICPSHGYSSPALKALIMMYSTA